ncbi:MAG: hypothetical protein M1828_005641 [Chrysothrix sp. TS-e1954]|nr:MAG: hypothetical protein M1828_005641 [Chrysothrix sp. TS-e1954]
MFVPDVAAHFQKEGFTALTYDPRTTGTSDGTPRNNIDPNKQVEDYSDALTYLASHPQVNASQICFWGFSFAGTVSLCAASLDKRAKLVIAVCPLTKFEYTPQLLPKVLAKAIKDRESQVMGNEPFYLPMLTEQGENPAGFGVGVEKENYDILVGAKREVAPSFELNTTIQTYYKLFMWQPFGLWCHLTPMPLLLVVPEEDKVSPAELQLSHFKTMSEPKEVHVESGKGHMDVLSGESFSSLMNIQVDFIRRRLASANGH